MAINLKKKATGEVNVTTKAKGQVLTEETKAIAVEAPPFTKERFPLEGSKEAQEADDAAEQKDQEDLEGAVYTEQEVPYCEIGFEASYTHNLGNYESARVVVSIKIPCLHPELDEAFEYAKSWVDEKLNAVNAELKGE